MTSNELNCLSYDVCSSVVLWNYQLSKMKLSPIFNEGSWNVTVYSHSTRSSRQTPCFLTSSMPVLILIYKHIVHWVGSIHFLAYNVPTNLNAWIISIILSKKQIKIFINAGFQNVLPAVLTSFEWHMIWDHYHIKFYNNYFIMY